MNPFVYAWRLPKYRKAVLSCFACPKFRDSKRVRQNNKITQTKSKLNKEKNNVGP